jgi:adenosine deaminase
MSIELHLHVYGCIRARRMLDLLTCRRNVDWHTYEAAMAAAYGTVPSTRELVDRHRRGDAAAAAAFERWFVYGDEDGGDFDRFLAKFGLVYSGSPVTDPESTPAEVEEEVGRVVSGIGEDHVDEGISYAEYRIRLGGDLCSLPARAALESLLAAYDRQDDRITERLAISLERADPWSGWASVQQLALGAHGAALTAVDFCHVEEGHPPKRMEEFFSAVHRFNAAHPDRALAILYHVGESFRDKSLESAIRWVQEAAELGAHRLGHAIALGVDPELFGAHARAESVSERRDQIAYDLTHADGLRAAGVRVDRSALRDELGRLAGAAADATVSIGYDARRLAELRRRQRYAIECVRATGAVVEVCPTSNRRIAGIRSWTHHPLHAFLDAQLPIVVSTDDPGVLGISLDEELDHACAVAGGGDELRRALVAAAWDSRSEVLTGRLAPAGG